MQRSIVFEGKKSIFFLIFQKKTESQCPRGPWRDHKYPQIWSQNRQTGPSVKIFLAESSQTNGIQQPPSIKCVPTQYRAARAAYTGSTLSVHLWLPRARACAGGGTPTTNEILRSIVLSLISRPAALVFSSRQVKTGPRPRASIRPTTQKKGGGRGPLPRTHQLST